MSSALHHLSLVTLACAAAMGVACGGTEPAPAAPETVAAPVASVPRNRAAHVRAVVQRLVDTGWLSGAVVAMHSDGGDTFVGVGRITDDQDDVPTADTVYEIGSATKVLTSLLLSDMVRRGEVTLDDPVESHLPSGFRVPQKHGKLITLAHLASHTAGLPRQPPGFTSPDAADPYAAFTAADLRKALAATTLSTRPGETYLYSNYGAGLLGFALGHALEQSYEQGLATRVLSPLGMKSTGARVPTHAESRRAQGHDADGRAVKPWRFQALAGAGAVRSTARDMLAFVRANLRLDRPAFAESMRLTHVPRHPLGPAPSAGHVGLGWHITEAGVRWHNGSTGGFHSFIAFDARRRVAVVVLASTKTWVVDKLGRTLLEPRPASGYVLATPRAIVVAPEVLQRYTGRYEFAPNVVLDVARDKDGLTGRLTGQSSFRMYPESQTRFFLRLVEAHIEFEIDKSGAVARALLIQGGRTQPAARKP